MSTEIVCVHRAASFEEAEVVIAWLKEQGIDAWIEEEFPPGPLESALPVQPKGIEVFVATGEPATRAKDLLDRHGDELRGRISKPASSETLEVVCEECNQASRFSGDKRGQVESCTHCGAYVDVPE